MSAARTIALVLSTAALVVGCCYLPYLFPPSEFIVGASDEAGFNNSAAYWWYVAFVFVPVLIAVPACLARLAGRPVVTTNRLSQRVWVVFAAIAALHVIGFAALYLYKGRLFFSEAGYFQIVLFRMVDGERLNHDVHFYYGPSMIYPAFWLAKAMSPQAAYAVWYSINYVAGLGILMTVLRRLLPSDRVATSWFILLALGLINPWNGLNATFVRYVLPTLVLLCVADAVWRGGARRIAAAIAALAFVLAYTFEAAAAAVASSAVFVIAALSEPFLRSFVTRVWPAAPASPETARDGSPPNRLIIGRAAAIAGAGFVAAIGFFLAVDPSGALLRTYPEIALSYVAGAHNLPISPNLPFLAMIGVSIAALAFAVGVVVTVPGSGTSLMVALTALAIVTERGAFGVSHAYQITFYSLPMVFLYLATSTWMDNGNSKRKTLAITVVLGMLLPLQFHHATQFWPIVAKLIGRYPPAADNADASSAVPVLSSASVEATLTELVHCAGTTRPYVMYDLEYYSQPVYQREHLRHVGYYPMLLNARTHEGVQRMIREVRAAKAIVIAGPASLGPYRPPPRHSGPMKVFDTLMGVPTAGSELGEINARSMHRLFEPFLDFVKAEYRPVCTRDGLVAYGPAS